MSDIKLEDVLKNAPTQLIVEITDTLMEEAARRMDNEGLTLSYVCKECSTSYKGLLSVTAHIVHSHHEKWKTEGKNVSAYYQVQLAHKGKGTI